MLARCDQRGMLGEGWRQSTAVLAHTPVPAFWAEWGEMGHPAGTFVDRLSASAIRVCEPLGVPSCLSCLSLLIPSALCPLFMSGTEGLPFSASVLGSSLPLRDGVVSCQPHVSSGPSILGPSQACPQGHRGRGNTRTPGCSPRADAGNGAGGLDAEGTGRVFPMWRPAQGLVCSGCWGCVCDS